MATLVVQEADLPKVARKIAAKLQPGDVLGLAGPLAAGKTTFTRQLLLAMGYTGAVTSPTFIIEQRYPVNWHGITEVLHLDLYRLGEADLQALDWDDYRQAANQLTIIEWPAVAERYLPKRTQTITLEIIDAKTRRLTVPAALA